MPMTDTDRLATPADMADVLRRLMKILLDLETLPESAQDRFWEDDRHIALEDLRIDPISMRSVTVLHNILVTMCGPRFAEMVNGEVKDYYERMLAQVKEGMTREWDVFLDQKFDETLGTDHEGSITARAALATIGSIGAGSLSRVSKIFKLTDVNGVERYFSSKDIIMMELVDASSRKAGV